MSNELVWDDEEKFKNKLKIHIFLCFVLLLLVFGLHIMRSDSVMGLSNTYNNIKTKEKWLQQYQPVFTENILAKAMQPTTKDLLEAVRQEKANLFLKHKLKIDNIVNGTLEKNQTNKGLPGVESAANLEGNWQDLCSCLSEFVKANLCAITGLSIDGREGGNLKARLSYRIYYR